MKQWASAVWLAVYALWRQLWLWLDQGGNVVLGGVVAVVTAFLTGARQNVAYADETMSAHAWRSWERGRLFGGLKILIDLLFFWQPQDEEVNQRAGRPIPGHCERAYWKELIRREMPKAYRDFIHQQKEPS